ncbi:MAG: ribokinase [Phycisphaerales bacterium]|nr:ribokinase [Phycisphaerales bacterium]
MPRIVVLGSINMDLVVTTPRFPAPGETLLGGAFQTFPGGKGANQAVAAARLGAEVTFIGCVGRDAWGAELRALLASEKIDVAHVLSRGGERTGVAVITVDAAGQNTIVVASGANMALTTRDVEAAREVIEQADAVLMQLESPLPAVQRAAEIARQHDVPVILNAAPAQRLSAALLECVDVLIVNEGESRIVSDLHDPALSHAQVASHLCSLSGGHVVVTLGRDGAVHCDGQTTTRQPAPRVEVIDTTAAGDAFAGAWAVGWCEGLSVEQTLALANAAGAAAVSRKGAIPSLPRRAEVESLLSAAEKRPE